MTNGTTEVPTIVEALAAVKQAVTEGRFTPEQIIKMVGRKKGRKVPELPTFTFPDSGYSVRVRKIGPWTLDQIRLGLQKVRQPPPIPMIQVPDKYDDAGEEIGWRNEPHESDPAYKQALQEYETWLNLTSGYRLLDIVMSSCIVVDKEDIDPEEVAAFRRGLLLAGPQPSENEVAASEHRRVVEAMSDEEIFVRCACMSTGNDTEALQSFVISRSMPTQEAIQEQVDTFQPEVQG